MIKFKNKFAKIDTTLLLLVAAISLFGLVMVYNSSINVAQSSFGDKFYFAKNQIIWALIGIGAFYFTLNFDYHHFRPWSFWIFLVALILMIAVFIPGLGVKSYGAQRWLNLRVTTFQPAEFMKLAYVFYLSSWLSREVKNLQFFVITGVIALIVILQRDLGTTTVIAGLALSIYYLSGAKLHNFLIILSVSFVGFLGFILSSPYRLARLTTFLDPEKDTLGISYHINQVLIALGSGGVFGLGLGQSRQKYEYIPSVMTDSIFAIIGEELGFIGSALLIFAFIAFFYRGFKIAAAAPDKYGQILAGGIISWFAIQTFVNLGSMVAVIPLTGVPLPFISYGGSSLVIALAAVGVLLNISSQSKR